MFSKKSHKKTNELPPRRRVAQPTDDAVPREFTSQKPVVPTRPSGAVSQPPGQPTDQFRRNRTLSSYRTPNTPAASERAKAHHLTIQRRKAGSLFAIAFAVVALLAVLLWQMIAQVQVATSTKPLAVSFSGEVYSQTINDYVSLNPTQRLRGLLDADALSAFVADAHPEVERVTLGGFSGIAHGAFALTFRVPVAGWQIGTEQYFVDADGVVFKNNYYQTPDVQIVDESGVPPEQGTAVAGSRLLGFIGKVVALAGERGHRVVKVVLPASTTRTVDVTFADNPTQARLTIDRGAGEQVEDFDRSVRFLTSQGQTAQYIDVRVKNRAAYK